MDGLERRAGELELAARLEADVGAALGQADQLAGLLDRRPAVAVAQALEHRADRAVALVGQRQAVGDAVAELLVLGADAPVGLGLAAGGEILGELVAALDEAAAGLGDRHGDSPPRRCSGDSLRGGMAKASRAKAAKRSRRARTGLRRARASAVENPRGTADSAERRTSVRLAGAASARLAPDRRAARAAAATAAAPASKSMPGSGLRASRRRSAPSAPSGMTRRVPSSAESAPRHGSSPGGTCGRVTISTRTIDGRSTKPPPRGPKIGDARLVDDDHALAERALQALAAERARGGGWRPSPWRRGRRRRRAVGGRRSPARPSTGRAAAAPPRPAARAIGGGRRRSRGGRSSWPAIRRAGHRPAGRRPGGRDRRWAGPSAPRSRREAPAPRARRGRRC